MEKNIKLIKHTLEFTEHEIATIEIIIRKSMTDLVDLYDKISRKTISEMDESTKGKFNTIRNTTFTIEAVQKKLEKFLTSNGAIVYEFPKFKVQELGLTRIKKNSN